MKFNFHVRPMYEQAKNSAEACYHKNRLALSYGTTDIKRTQVTGISGSTIYYQVRSNRLTGLVFYKAGRRMEIRDMVEAFLAHNKKVAADCGFTGEVDLPVHPALTRKTPRH